MLYGSWISKVDALGSARTQSSVIVLTLPANSPNRAEAFTFTSTVRYYILSPPMMEAEKEEVEKEKLDGGCLEDLPKDVMNKVLSFLFLDEFEILSLVSWKMHDSVSTTSHLVTRFISQHMLCFSKAGFRRLLGRFQSLSILGLDGLYFLDSDVFTILNQSPAASTLRQIQLCNFRMREYRSILLEMRYLTHILLCGNISENCGSITTSTNLNRLSINDQKLRDGELTALIHPHRKTLQYLHLQNCVCLKKPALQLDRLEWLDISSCNRLLDLPELSCPRLRKLHLRDVPRLVESGKVQSLVDSLLGLQHLKMEVGALTKLEIRSLTLESLEIRFCRALETLTIYCPNLSHLEVRGT